MWLIRYRISLSHQWRRPRRTTPCWRAWRRSPTSAAATPAAATHCAMPAASPAIRWPTSPWNRRRHRCRCRNRRHRSPQRTAGAVARAAPATPLPLQRRSFRRLAKMSAAALTRSRRRAIRKLRLVRGGMKIVQLVSTIGLRKLGMQ